MKSLFLACLFSACCLAAHAQAPAPEQVKPPAVTIPSTGFAGLDQYRASRIAVYTNDYGQLARYRDANAALKPPAPGENRVVFFGDSITDIWKLEGSFPGKPYVNRGIGGQTTSQMLVRFRQDVITCNRRWSSFSQGRMTLPATPARFPTKTLKRTIPPLPNSLVQTKFV